MDKKSLALFALLLVSTQPALAHDAWLQDKEGSLTIMFGHGKSDPYDPQQVQEARAYDCTRQSMPVHIIRHKDSASLSFNGNPATATALFAGTVVKTTEGYKKITKKEAQGKYKIVEALRYRKYCKALLKPCETFSRPVGLAMEIVPEKNPFAMGQGETLPVQVLLDGKPVEGAAIATGDSGHSKSKPDLKTDKDGKVTVVITKPGHQLIVASHKVPLKDDPDADTLSLCTSLAFEAK